MDRSRARPGSATFLASPRRWRPRRSALRRACSLWWSSLGTSRPCAARTPTGGTCTRGSGLLPPRGIDVCSEREEWEVKGWGPVRLSTVSSEGILKVRPIWVKTLKARLAVDLGQNDKSGPARGKMVKVAPPQARENFGHSTLRRMPLAPPSRQMVPRQLQPSQRVKCCGRMRPYVSQTCSATCLDTHRRALSRGERQHFF